MLSIFKNYVIENEEDIPKEFLDSIKNEETFTERSFPSSFMEGKTGKTITDLSEIRNIFSDNDCFYAGHGTDEMNIPSIFHEGLYAKDPEDVKGYMATLRGLSSTIVEWGPGDNNLFDNKQNDLNNWQHKEAKSIIIVEIPQEYILFLARYSNNDEFEPFYIKNKRGEGYQGLKLRPEFIRGVYDANNGSFIENENFYKKLSKEQQELLFEEIRKQYISSYANSVLICPSECEFKLPLSEEDLQKADYEWYRVQYKRMQDDKNSEYIPIEDDAEEEFTENDEELAAMFDNDEWKEDIEDDIKII